MNLGKYFVKKVGTKIFVAFNMERKNLFFVAMKCSLHFDKFLSPFILIVNWWIVTRRTTVGKFVLMYMYCMREFAH